MPDTIPSGLQSTMRRFRAAGIVAFVLVYLVVVAGGVVRMTGSGMGCPDWPKCFGQYIPPTDISQLPADYKTRYDMGHGNVEFNAYKTWTEYINRLIGAISGLGVLGLAVFGLGFLRHPGYRWRLALALFVVFLIGFQAWLGKVVVASNLLPNTITIHMVVAVVILALLLFLVFSASPHWLKPKVVSVKLGRLSWVVLGLAIAQLVLGTQVREAIDAISHVEGFAGRADWVDRSGTIFIIHRTFSWGVLLLFVLQAYWAVRERVLDTTGGRVLLLASALVGVEILAGIGLAHLGMPPALQPIHLVFAFGVILAQCWVVLSFGVGTRAANSQATKA